MADLDDKHEAFRARVLRVLSTTPNVTKYAAKQGEFAIELTVEGESATTFYLTNLYAETREVDPDRLDDEIRAFVARMLVRRDDDDVSTWADAAPMLLPVLRASTFALVVELQGPVDAAKKPIRRPFATGVTEHAVIDMPTRMMVVTRSQAKDWGASDEQVLRRARENAVSKLEPIVERYDGDVFIVTSNDTYESSRLLVPGFLSAFRNRVKGTPIAIIPERAQCLVAGDADPSIVVRLLEYAEREWSASSRSISPAIYGLSDDDRVVPYVRAGNDDVAQRVRLAQLKLELREYAEQKNVLDKVHERDMIDLFVASHRAIRRNTDGRPLSLAVWTKDVDALLPVVDLLHVFEKDGKSFLVPFRTAMTVAHNHLQLDPAYDPPRVRARGWADEPTMQALERAQVTIDAYA